MLALLPIIILYAVTIILYALTREDLAGTASYWEYFVPVVAFISIITAWANAYARGDSRLLYLIRQIIIWGAFLWMLLTLQAAGVEAALGSEKTTITLILMLAMVAMLVGLYLDAKMFFYSLFLGLCGYLLADPANVAVLGKIGETLKIEDAANKPMMMIMLLAIGTFLISIFLLLSTRGSVAARRSR
ncbi:hypothetical protein G3480_01150 [Thiorhodococcus mannitoliphagus]|uniref:Uncharacterized protein n=2 Tax=Thiorhodococcus mannitoliphagus TaxID=329406 RepID=A0A6P1DT97_9GAMM|nr:hypothetical protein [Thiorhodococcus mannitoliphagus]NEX18935.1 hypothetical protein [Thiorhodococcus mannitoliphagus]